MHFHISNKIVRNAFSFFFLLLLAIPACDREGPENAMGQSNGEGPQTPSSKNFQEHTYQQTNDFWEKSYGGHDSEWAYSAVAVDNGYVVGGLTESFGPEGVNAYLMMIDPSGKMIWHKAFGGSELDVVNDLVKANNGIIASGITQSGRFLEDGDGQVYLIKVNNKGKLQWERKYGGSSRDGASSIVATGDGNYIVAGVTESYGKGGKDVYVIKINEKGEKLWEQHFGGAEDDIANSVISLSDNGCIVVGSTESFRPEGKRIGKYMYLLRLNSDGTKIWKEVYGEASDPEIFGKKPINKATDIFKIPGHDTVLVLGETSQLASADKNGGQAVCLLKLNKKRKVIWDRKIVIEAPFDMLSIAGKLKKGFIAAGSKPMSVKRSSDVFLIQIDEEGKKKSTSHFGQKSDQFRGSLEEAYSIVLSGDDRGYLIVGKNERHPDTGQAEDIYVIKVNENGNIPESPPKKNK